MVHCLLRTDLKNGYDRGKRWDEEMERMRVINALSSFPSPCAATPLVSGPFPLRLDEAHDSAHLNCGRIRRRCVSLVWAVCSPGR